MKNLILLAAVLFSFAACTMHDGYTIKGVITGESEALKSGKVHLKNVDKATPIAQTVDIINGEFIFKGKVSTPEHYIISIDGVNGVVEVFVENERFVIKGSDSNLDESQVKGGISHQLMAQLKTKYSELKAKYDIEKIVAEYRLQETAEERKKEIMTEYDKFSAEVKAFENRILEENPLSHYSLQNLYRSVGDGVDIDEAKEKLRAFKADSEFEGNRIISAIEEKIIVVERLQPGQIAPNFTLECPKGDEVSLSDIYKKNKITMIDFWAGWCGPCRKFNPTLVSIYKQFRGQGFQVLGVSFDRDRATWLKAIKDDKLTWPQVSDLMYWNSEIVKLYNVKSIPMNVFVNQEGVIIANKLDKDKIVEFLKVNL